MTEKPDIIQTAQALGCLPEKQSGGRFVGGNCPAKHGSENGRCFNIWESTQSFHCFHCGAGGDAFELIKVAQGVDFSQALSWAREQALITGNGHNEASYLEQRKAYAILTGAAKFFHSNLKDYTHLKTHYGLTEDTIQQYLIGYAPTDKHALKKALISQGYKLEDIQKTGLLGKYDDSLFQGQYIFPYWNHGLVKYFIGRQTPETPTHLEGKYIKLRTTDIIKNNFFYGEDSIIGKDVVYVTEGVTDCLAALQHGLSSISPVTTQFKKSDHPKLLNLVEGKRGYLLPDNEENEAGIKGAQETLKFLKDNGVDASIITLPRPEGKEKVDLNEYIRDHGIDAFHRLVEEQAPQAPTLEQAIILAQDFIALDIPPRKVHLHPWLGESSINMICGPRGIGKTMFAFSIFESVARGASFGPWLAGESANALYLDGELTIADISERSAYFVQQNYLSNLYIYSDHYGNHLGLPRANLLDEDWRKAMKEFLLSKNIKLWCVDNIASLAPGIDENSKKEWDPINRFFLDLRFSGIGTTFVHHTGKEGQQRGTSGREDNIDIALMLNYPPNYARTDGCKFVAKFTKARIRNRDLHLIGETEFTLMEDPQGNHVWTFKAARKATKIAVITMLDEGISSKDIAETLDVSPGLFHSLKRKRYLRD